MKTSIYFFAAVLILFSSCKKAEKLTYPTDGLISHFDFNDQLKDELGFWYEGNKIGNPSYVTGLSGKAISFNGIDQGLSFSPVIPSSVNAFTVSFWFKESLNPKGEFIFDFPDFDIGSNAAQQKAYLLMSATGVTASSKLNRWNHVACIYDGDSMHIYVNGLPGEKKKVLDVIGAYKGEFKVGYIASSYWSGSVDELFLYNRALTQAEVKQLFQYHRGLWVF
jgi:hypothetical protein